MGTRVGKYEHPWHRSFGKSNWLRNSRTLFKHLGWLKKDGTTDERIYDVAVSDGRKIDSNGRCTTPVGNTAKGASYTNTIGDPLLTGYWKDPYFDPAQKAFYYVRVIEILKPSWQAYDAKYYKVKMGKEVPMTVQDRAYTSPIWYTPGK